MSSNEWEKHTVSDLIAHGHLAVGDGYRAKNSELSNDGLPFARAGNINNGFYLDNAECLDKDNIHRAGAKVSRPSDVVFTSKGTVGRFALVQASTPQFVYSPQLCYWRSLNPELIFPSYLYYWMQSNEFYKQFKAVAGQTDMAEYVSLSDQRRMSVTLPPLPVQQRIAAILSALDEKIELNRQMNRTLEAIAQALFKEWFVDFRFPGATGELQERPLGMIPKGWQVKSLPQVMKINPARPLKKGAVAKYLDMGNMPTDSARALEFYPRAYGSGSRFTNGDTLVARITPCLENGKTAFVDFLDAGEVGWGSTEYLVFNPLAPLPPEFAYYLARTERFRSFAIGQMIGSSGRQRVPASAFDAFLIALPPEPVAKLFGGIVNTLMKVMKAKDEEAATLTEMRDNLLPKLLSGQIEVPVVEEHREKLADIK